MIGAPLVVADAVTVRRGTAVILDQLSLGLHAGDRIGIVGRNGSGKTTLLTTLAGSRPPDDGRVTRNTGTTVVMVGQDDTLPGSTVADVLVGDVPEHEWASRPNTRAVMTGLLGGVTAPFLRAGLATPVAGLSGGERRRIALAGALVREPDVLLLDEPTNHLDLEAVRWLADHLDAWPRGRRALAVVTHDRWLLDAVTQRTWQVLGGQVTAFDGGYAAYVLAKVERDRRDAQAATKRRNLLRRELAWLRRGAPARTRKSKFRLDAADTLIADEPPPRDSLVLHRVAGARLGKTVVELEDLTLAPADGAAPVLRDQTWGIGPGDRVGLLGPNGAGKTTLLRLLAGADELPHTGSVRRGRTVVPAMVGQQLAEVDAADRVLPWLERAGNRLQVTGGDDLTAARLLELFGFTGDAPWKRLGDLSGGERRRLHLMRTLLAGPNLLLLDEPTNDLDIETLTVLEDVLDSWIGSLVVVSHDRYFLERTCDDVWAMLGDARIRHLPGGVDEYLRLRAGTTTRDRTHAGGPGSSGDAGRTGTAESVTNDRTSAGAADRGVRPGSAQERQARKDLARVERALERIARRKAQLHEAFTVAATDPDRLLELTRELREVEREESGLEEEWLAIAEEA